jgi:hypothetical protein
MPASRPALSYDVFAAPKLRRPWVGDRPACDPITSTLIFGARDAVLADSLMTVREAAALVSPIAGGV